MNEKKNLNPIKLLIGVFLSLTLIISIIFIGVILMPVEHLYVAAKDLTAEVTESDRPTNFAPCEIHDSETGAICDGQALVVSSERELAYVFKHGVEIAGGGSFTCLKINIEHLPYGYVNMSYWNGDFFAGTNENPLNAHIDFGGLEVRIKGGASTLFLHKTPQTVIQNLNIVDANNANDAKLVPMNYATTGPCEHSTPTDSHQAIYVNTEQEMKDWFANYSNSANPTKTKCLNVKIPFVTTITTQLVETDYIQSKHYDFGGATIIHNLKYLLPGSVDTTPTISNLIVRMTGSDLKAGITPEIKGTIENCTVIAYGTITTHQTPEHPKFGGIAGYGNKGSKIINCKFILEDSANITIRGKEAGGIVGYTHGTIENCRAEFPKPAGVNTNVIWFGGVAGFLTQSATMKNSSASVYIDSYNSTNRSTGGLVGEIGNGGQLDVFTVVEDCYSEGDEISGYNDVGGAIGTVNCTAGRSPSILRTKSFVKRVTTRYSMSSSSRNIQLGGFIGYTTGGYGASGLDITDCISFTEPYTDNGTYKSDAPAIFQGGFVGYSALGVTNYTNCGVYINQITYGSNGKHVVAGGFIGEFPSGINNTAIREPKIYVKNWVNKGGMSVGRFGTLFGAAYSNPGVTSNPQTTIIYKTQPTMYMDGVSGSDFEDRITITSWPSSQPFGAAGVKPSVNALSGSSVSQVSSPVSGKQIKFKFTGLADYYLDNIYISMNDFATDINIGGYTQIMHDGTLLSDFSAKSIVGTVPKSHSRGDSNILAQDEFYFYYKSPNTSNSEVTVKVQLKHKTTGAKRTFMLFKSSQWVEL